MAAHSNDVIKGKQTKKSSSSARKMDSNVNKSSSNENLKSRNVKKSSSNEMLNGWNVHKSYSFVTTASLSEGQSELYDVSDESLTPTPVLNPSQKDNTLQSTQPDYSPLNFTLPPSQTDYVPESMNNNQTNTVTTNNADVVHGRTFNDEGIERPIFDAALHGENYSGTVTPILESRISSSTRNNSNSMLTTSISSATSINSATSMSSASATSSSQNPEHSPIVAMDTSLDDVDATNEPHSTHPPSNNKKGKNRKSATASRQTSLKKKTSSPIKSSDDDFEMSEPHSPGFEHSQMHSPSYFTESTSKLLRRISSSFAAQHSQSSERATNDSSDSSHSHSSSSANFNSKGSSKARLNARSSSHSNSHAGSNSNPNSNISNSSNSNSSTNSSNGAAPTTRKKPTQTNPEKRESSDSRDKKVLGHKRKRSETEDASQNPNQTRDFLTQFNQPQAPVNPSESSQLFNDARQMRSQTRSAFTAFVKKSPTQKK